MFAALTVDGRNHFAGQAVKLLNKHIGLFLYPIVKYRRLPIRKFIEALGVETITVSSVYGSRFFVASNNNL